MLLPQDLYILLKLCCIGNDWTFRSLSESTFVSQSQIHAGLKRAEIANLFLPQRRDIQHAALEEVLVHGVRWIYPVERGGLIRGMVTSFAGPPLNDSIVAGDGPVPVWPYANGDTTGYKIEPLHPAAPKAALLDSKFYELLCLVDAVREGRARERQLAQQEIRRRIKPVRR